MKEVVHKIIKYMYDTMKPCSKFEVNLMRTDQIFLSKNNGKTPKNTENH